MGFGFGKERGGVVCLWHSCIEWFWYNDKVERWGGSSPSAYFSSKPGFGYLGLKCLDFGIGYPKQKGM